MATLFLFFYFALLLLIVNPFGKEQILEKFQTFLFYVNQVIYFIKYHSIMITAFFVLLLFPLLAIFYILGAFAYALSDSFTGTILSRETNSNFSLEEISKALKKKQLFLEIEKGIRIIDFIYAKDQNVWVDQSNKYLGLSLFFGALYAASFSTFWFSILTFLLIQGFNIKNKSFFSIFACNSNITKVMLSLAIYLALPFILLEIFGGIKFLYRRLQNHRFWKKREVREYILKIRGYKLIKTITWFTKQFKIYVKFCLLIMSLIGAIGILQWVLGFLNVEKDGALSIQQYIFDLLVILNYITALSFLVAVHFRHKAKIYFILAAKSNEYFENNKKERNLKKEYILTHKQYT
ncbi:hypothetical protein [Desulfurobacterium crinifex]